jgi:hypothetical protein
MPIANPTFADAGATPGSAARWTIRSLCRRARIAAFGPTPEEALESFERWCSHLSRFDDVVAPHAFFDAAPRGFEAFEAWLPGAFLFTHDDALLEDARFAGELSEDFGTAWVPALLLAWESATSIVASFGAAGAESFEAWTLAAPPTFANAAFAGSASAEAFKTSWPALGAT